MAKKKHSTALFEVITKTPRQSPLATPKAGALLSLPRWWFRGRSMAEAAFEAPNAVTAPIAVASAPSAPIPIVRRIVEEPALGRPNESNLDRPAGQIVLADPDESSSPADTEMEPETRIVAHETAVASEDRSDEGDGGGDGYSDILNTPRAQSVAVAVDPERRQINLRMSYTAAIVGGFAVLVIVGLSIIVGQHMSKSSVPLLAQTTTKKLRQEPPRREVLDPNRHTNNTFAPPSSPSPGSVINRGAGAGASNETRTADNHGAAENPAPTPGDEKRVFGLNYVIIQSYPKEEEKMAI